MNGLIVESLDVEIDGAGILRRARLAVPRGGFCVVVGPSGCGKSTLLRAIAGLRRPTAGRIAVDGAVLSDASTFLPPERRRIGWVPQEVSLFPHLTVARNVAFGRVRRGEAGSPAVRDLLELTGLTALAGRYPDQLSGGQAARVALARALAAGPRVLLLDEPFAALDPGLRTELREELRGMLRQLEVTAVLVTHDQAEALELADVVAVMRDGIVVQQGAPAEVYRRPADTWTASFLGETVLLDGSATGDRAATALGEVPLDRPASGAVTVMLRPEQLALGGPGLQAEVSRVRYGGHDALVELRVDGETGLVARVQADGIPRVGERIGVRVRGTAVAYGGDALAADQPAARA